MTHPGPPRPRTGPLAAVALVAVLLTPAAAAGHVRSGIAATDYRVTLDALPPDLAAAAGARVFTGDRALAVTVQSGHTVVVLGRSGEPLLRLEAGGAAVNQAAPGGTPAWAVVSRGSGYTWHDERLRGLPADVERRRWTVPLLVDGERVAIGGELVRVRAPALGPWLALALAVALAAALLGVVRRPPVLRAATVALGALAGIATIVLAGGFAAGEEASAGTGVESANEIVLALAGLGVLAFGSQTARMVACALLGLLGVFAGLLKLGVLEHGVILAALPAAAARAAVVVAVSAGAGAVLVAAVAFATPAGRGAGAVDPRKERAAAQLDPPRA